MTWKPVGKKDQIERGAHYRSTYYFSVPYGDIVSNIVLHAFGAARGVAKLAGITITDIYIRSPEYTPQTGLDGRFKRWCAIIHWRKG